MALLSKYHKFVSGTFGAIILTTAVYTFILWPFAAGCSFWLSVWWVQPGGSAPLTGGIVVAWKGRESGESGKMRNGSWSVRPVGCALIALCRSLGPNGWAELCCCWVQSSWVTARPPKSPSYMYFTSWSVCIT